MARKSKNKPLKFKVAIVGEGETEWYYFTDMRHFERFSFKVEPELPKHSDFKTIINTARKKRDEGYDLVFCVLDMDRISNDEKERKDYVSWKSKKSANRNIEFIETMPCIELWFLLHFLENHSSRIYLNYEQVKKPLKKFIPNYDKTASFLRNSQIYRYLLDKGSFEKADEYALKLFQEKENNGNPFSNYSQINELVKKLREYK